ncbi:tRNA 2-thiouridine(34) synthase MnmA [Geomesophilobacter sediminis]|uniref:tRNA-specific 2-thiouridylase MnmA n=1 Tax=Geomesophilobacter sediminis TaxID=2798584 RepID=A0A8J7JA28_9BACT|nr:tRNA 2-thiouridine(34) synthase MnmA [Geomesophilobacter sediminis]MBJ6723636.1 tRNA 2-thiouridine(34) synthase MnmA [Geomesophilobacter sediminis]
MDKKTVLMAMSGGVDSSVSAALLKEQGYNVIGVSMQLYERPESQASTGKTCCSLTDVLDAGRVAKRLGIPFEVIDLRDRFKELVMDNFLEEYAAGRTPNPCARCNERIKFGLLLEMADSFGADSLATGHYARIRRDPDGIYQLLKGLDPGKDQSYFLFGMSQPQLSRILFPVGELEKPQVRELATRFNLPVAAKKESQEICFIPDNDYVGYLEANGIPSSAGDIVTGAGVKVGTHKGIHQYTVGQRRGLGIAWEAPLYVTGLDREHSRVIVGPREELRRTGLVAATPTWTSVAPAEAVELTCSIRYRQKPVPCRAALLPDGKLRVDFVDPQYGVTPGQAVVLYDGERVVGGAWIEEGI